MTVIEGQRRQRRADGGPETGGQIFRDLRRVVQRDRESARRRRPAAAGARRPSNWRSRRACAPRAPARPPTAARRVKPSGERALRPSRCCRVSVATRIMKNSSRLFAAMARNFTRSSSGCASLSRMSQDALVERQPAQLAVDVQRWIGQVRWLTKSRLRVGRRRSRRISRDNQLILLFHKSLRPRIITSRQRLQPPWIVSSHQTLHAFIAVLTSMPTIQHILEASG